MNTPPSNAPPVRIAAIVLAAGMSGRMGTLKPLLPFGDRPMIARILETLRTAAIFDPLLVITGHESAAIAAAVSPFAAPNLTCIHNPDFAAGEMLSSIHRGLAALPADIAAFLLVLADQPAVNPATIGHLLRHWQPNAAPLIIPTWHNQRGHPLLISTALIPEILHLAPPQTLRDLVHRHLPTAAQIPVEDPAILADIDTPEDYQRALQYFRETHTPS